MAKTRKFCHWDRSRQARFQRCVAATEERSPLCADQLRLAGRPGERSQPPTNWRKQIKLLLKDMGGSAKSCAIAVSDPERASAHHRTAQYPGRFASQCASAQWPRCSQPGVQRFRAGLRAGFGEARNGRGDPEWHRYGKLSARRVISRRRHVAPDGQTNFRSAQQVARCLPTSSSSHRSVPLTPSNSPTRKSSPTKLFFCSTWATCRAPC